MSHPITVAARHQGAIQIDEELDDLIALVEGRPLADVVVEVGTAGGGTFHMWATLASPTATLVSLDISPQRTPDELRRLAQTDQVVMPITADSNDPATVEQVRGAVDGRPVDILFIDADHREFAVRADVANLLPLVRKGGLAVFHDITPQDPSPNGPHQNIEVAPVWAELKAEYPEHYEFEHPRPESHKWGGIGVIVV